MGQIKKTAGILGGMGPEATVDLLRRIIAHTRASDDADHVRCLVDQNPHVPSRIKILLEGGDVSPGPTLAQMARGLEDAGADFLCIACNTAHNWYGEIAAAVNIPVLNIIEIAAKAAGKCLAPDSQGKVGILASPAVRLTGLYNQPCAKLGLSPVYADEKEEQELLGIIKEIKGGKSGTPEARKFEKIINHMRSKGAETLIIACTELGILDFQTDLPVVDAADALAKAVVAEAGAELCDG